MVRSRQSIYLIIAASLLPSVLFTYWPQTLLVARSQSRRMIPEKQLGAATASYFPKDNHVTVQARPLRVAGDTQNGIVLIPSFIVPGKKVVEPRLVNLQFIVDSPASDRRRFRNVQVFSDGRKLVSGIPTLVSRGRPVNGSATQVLMYKIPYGRFLRMLEGQEVRIRLGHVEFEVTEEQRALMRDLQRMITERVGFP